MKLKMPMVVLFMLLSSCCYLPNPLDGEAIQSCKMRNKAIHVCKTHGGLKEFYAIWADCNDGKRYDLIYDKWEKD